MPQSVLSGLTVESCAMAANRDARGPRRSKRPALRGGRSTDEALRPMLATPEKNALLAGGLALEVKQDGVRVLG